MLKERGNFVFPRTDLAIERRELIGEKIPDGVRFDEIIDGEIKTTKIKITNQNGAEALNKPIGRYYTVEFDTVSPLTDGEDERLEAIKILLDELLPGNGPVLVAGLGNVNITPDALGPKTADGVFATRHISDKTEQLSLPALRQVAVISTGVLGQTGMETVEILKAVSERIKPSAVIAVDALAAAGVKRLCRTVQLTDTGICPGSGVGNSRARIDSETLGCPVISIGVPTVIDAGSLCGNEKEAACMMVTPRDIDSVINGMSGLISACINTSLQKNLSFSEINMLL